MFCIFRIYCKHISSLNNNFLMKPSKKKPSNKVTIKEILIYVGQILINKDDREPYRIVDIKPDFKLEVKKISDNKLFSADLSEFEL